MTMLMYDYLLAAHIDPKSAGVAPTHAVEPMEPIVDLDLEVGLDSLSVSKHAGSIMSRERGVDNGGVGMNVVKINHLVFSLW